MKTVIYFLAIVGFTAASEIQTYSIASNLEDFLEYVRDQMPCGFPLLGIGPLAPLSISFKTIDFDTPHLKIKGSVQNFTTNNLNYFDILELTNSIVKRKVTGSLLFKNITLNTRYDLETYFQDAGLTVKLNGSGINDFGVNNLLISVTIKYGINVINSRINVKSIKLIPHIESAESNIEGILGNGSINRKLNKNLEVQLPAFVNAFGESIADKLIVGLLPKINKFLAQYSLNDILDGVGGNSSEGENIKCEI